MGNMRTTSVFACEIVTPGFSLAIPSQQKPIRNTSERLKRTGATSEILRSMNSNDVGKTPITV
jgi:hypothetical protein